jgi:hypothetical protein
MSTSTVRTGWDDSVLCHRYYSGLAERIKDIMGQQGKPVTLEAMKTLAHTINSHREATLYGSYRNVEFYNVSIVIGSMLSTE